jgi:tetratricopeptide (TPR) repeat protein
MSWAGALAVCASLLCVLPARAAGPSPLWEDVAHPNRPRCDAIVADVQKRLAERAADHAALEQILAGGSQRCPDHLALHALYGGLLVGDREFAAARAPLERARHLEDEGEGRIAPDPRLAFQLGLVRAVAGEIEGSLAEYRRAADLGGIGRDQWLLLYDLGDTFHALGRLAEAIDAYRRAIHLNGRRAVVHYALAVALDRDGQLAESAGALKDALALDPHLDELTSPDYFFLPAADRSYYLALSFRAQGRIPEARKEIEQFLHEAADSPYAARAREVLASMPR